MSALANSPIIEVNQKKIHNNQPHTRFTPIKLSFNQPSPIFLPKTSPKTFRNSINSTFSTFSNEKNICYLEIPNLYSQTMKPRSPIKYSKANQFFSASKRPEKYREDHRNYANADNSFIFRNISTPTRGVQPSKIKKLPKRHRRAVSIEYSTSSQNEGRTFNANIFGKQL